MFYLILFNFFFLVSPSAIYLCLIGHGFAYIPALIYLNIRVSSSRNIKVSLAYVIYFFGIALGATITTNHLPQNRTILHNHRNVNTAIGSGILITTILIFFGYVCNELLQFFMTDYNYRMSLDPNFQRENEAATIFDNKLFKIEGQEGQYDHLDLDEKKISSRFTIRDFWLIIFSIVSRVLNIICFYYPFIYINSQVTRNVAEDNGFHSIHWMAFGGLACLTILLRKTSTKPLLSWACILMIIMLHLQTIFISFGYKTPVVHIFMKFTFFIFGFGYSIPNLICFETIKLKYIEFILGIGYLVEMITVGTIMSSVTIDTEDWFCENINCTEFDYVIFQHSLSFVLFLIFVNFFGYYAVPKVAASKSLLESKNITKLKSMGYSAMELDKTTYYPRNWNKEIFSPRPNPDEIKEKNDSFSNIVFTSDHMQPPPPPPLPIRTIATAQNKPVSTFSIEENDDPHILSPITPPVTFHYRHSSLPNFIPIGGPPPEYPKISSEDEIKNETSV